MIEKLKNTAKKHGCTANTLVISLHYVGASEG